MFTEIWIQPAFTCSKVTIHRNTRPKSEICSKLTIKTLKRCHWSRSGVFIVNFEYISHILVVFLLLSLKMLLPAGKQDLQCCSFFITLVDVVFKFKALPSEFQWAGFYMIVTSVMKEIMISDFLSLFNEYYHPLLTYFMPLVSFYTPWKHQKDKCSLMFSGGMEKD